MSAAQSAPTRKRMPSFGRQVAAWRAAGLAPTTDLFISVGWNFGRAWKWRIVVPNDNKPDQLDYSCTAGLSCLMFGDRSPRMDDVARAVVPFGPSRLVGVCIRPSLLTVYLPGELSKAAL